MIWNGIILTVICFTDNFTFIIYQIWLHILSFIFWADLFCLHTATTKIGKVRIMPLSAAYGDIYHINISYIKNLD